MNNDYIIILDTETTGLSPESGSEITEIGALKVHRDTLEIVDQFQCLIKIDGNVNHFIEKLTGINDNLLQTKGIDPVEAYSLLSRFCGAHEIYAHNASFDKRFIRHFLDKYSIRYIPTNWIDTISIFRSCFPNRRTYKLESLIIDYGLASFEEHRALSDAKHTLSLLRIALGK